MLVSMSVTDGTPGADDRDADIVEVLQDVLEWRLAAARWPQVEQVLAVLRAALADGDTDLVVQALTDLELCGPVRVVRRLGAQPATGTPDPLREIVVEMIHSLSHRNSRTSRPAEQGGRDDRRS